LSFQNYSQGLTYANGHLYESTGLYGKSTVRILDPDTAKVIKKVSMESALFGEGMAYINDELIQITWKSRQGFVYDPDTLEVKKNYTYQTTLNEGWGITFDECRNEIIVTDGSQKLHFWDPKTFRQKRKIDVKRMSGEPAKELNEIEFWRGRILANVWYEDVILVINPVTGVVEKEYGTYFYQRNSTRRTTRM
jgi:glutamine cyclotransferase